MDNYRERIHQFINIQGSQFSDIFSKHDDVKRNFVYFTEIKNICRNFFGFDFISFQNRGDLSAAPCITQGQIQHRMLQGL